MDRVNSTIVGKKFYCFYSFLPLFDRTLVKPARPAKFLDQGW